MKRLLTLLAGAATGTLGAVLVGRTRRVEHREGPPSDPRAEELRRKLAEARATAADEDDFEAAGMAGETMVEDETAPAREEIDEARRRVHEEARSTAEEMRRGAEEERA